MGEKTPAARLEFLKKKWNSKLDERRRSDISCPAKPNIFERLVEADPTHQKVYVEWICRVYNAQGFLYEDRERVKNTLTLFHRWKHRLPREERDIGRHATEQSVWATVERFDPSNVEDVNPEGRELRRRDRAKALAESELLESADLDGWILATPQTPFASSWWGRGTRWCTAEKDGRQFASYDARGPLRIFVDPNGDKFQAHMASAACADATDRMINFSAFVDRLPLSAVEVLKTDVVAKIAQLDETTKGQSSELVRVITALPMRLVDDELIADLKATGRSRITPLIDHDGWSLNFVSDQLAKWALNLASGKGASSRANYLLLKSPQSEEVGFEINGDSLDPVRKMAAVIKDAPKDFRDQVAIKMVEVWTPNAGNRDNAFLGTYFFTVGTETVPQKAWVDLANKVAKGKHQLFNYGVPFEHVDDAVADELANGSTLALIPPDMITRERVKRILSKHPELLKTEIPSYGLEHFIDAEIAMAVASWNKGRGLGLVPDEYKTEEFCLQVLESYPLSLPHVPIEFLTQEICYGVMDREGLMWKAVPDHFWDEELFVRAAASNGTIMPHVPAPYQTERVGQAGIDNTPDAFPHVNMELTYDNFLRGVSRSGSLLARVPLVYRDETMCAAAMGKQTDALPHVPPRVREMLVNSPDEKIVSFLSRAHSYKISVRYPLNDPIRTFLPDPHAILPERLRALTPLKGDLIVTGPTIEAELSSEADNSRGAVPSF